MYLYRYRAEEHRDDEDTAFHMCVVTECRASWWPFWTHYDTNFYKYGVRLTKDSAIKWAQELGDAELVRRDRQSRKPWIGKWHP